jgi:glycosyltransferase involved in cell wall biosynthesis
VPRVPPKPLRSLSAVIPAFDEEANLPATVRAAVAILPTVADRWELIIVDDGSADGTGALADRWSRAEPQVRVVHHARNRGYGAAMRSGLAAARYEYVFATDGDQQFDLGELPRLVARCAEAEVVVGYRRRRADHVLRRLNTWAWNHLVRMLFRLPVRDVNCAFKLFRRDAVPVAELSADGAMVSTELLARALRRGCRIVEVAVGHFPRRHGSPSGANPRVVARAFVELLGLLVAFHRRPTRAPARRRVRVSPAGAPRAERLFQRRAS